MDNTQQFGDYVLTEQLRQDATGTLHRAVHATSNDPVTIKILHRKDGEPPDRVARFNRTVEVLRRIKHPAMVQVVDHGESPRGLYLVTENLTGELLDERLKRDGRLPLEETQRIVGAVAGALAAAHRMRLVHGDLQADSVFLGQAGADGAPAEVKLLDVGLAKLFGDGTLSGGNGSASSRGIDKRADIQALGRLAYQMLCGETPEKSGAAGAGSEPGRRRPARLSTHGVTVPSAIEAAILKALERKKKRRFSSMTEFARALGAEVQPAVLPSPEPEVVLALGDDDLAFVERPQPPPLPAPKQAASLPRLISARAREVGRTALRRPKVVGIAAAASVAVLASGWLVFRPEGQPGAVAVAPNPAPAPVKLARVVDVARAAPAASAPTRVDEILALNQKAVSAYQQGDIKTARGLLLQADKLAIASGYKDAPVRAQTQVRLGALFVAQKKPRLGRPYLARAVAINPAVRIPPGMMSPQIHKTLIATKQKARLAKAGPPSRGPKSQPARRGRDLRKS